MKKIITLVFAFAIALSTLLSPAGASAHGTKTDSCGCSGGATVEKPEGFEEISTNQSAKVYGQLASDEEFKKATKWLRSEGLAIKPNEVVGVSMDTIGVMGERLNNVNHYTWIAQSKDGKQFGMVVAIVDQQTGTLEHLKADAYNNMNEEGFESVTSYIKDIGFTGEMSESQYGEYLDQLSGKGEIGTAWFSACDHASIWLCLHHCGMWALLNGYAGLACGAICGYAFSYAC
jgi:putative immunity protein/bacteriocin